MRSISKLVAACLAAVAMTGCKGDPSGNPTGAVIPPLAYVRYFNAIADTLPIDFRPIDQIEFSQPFLAVPFRGVGLGNYQGWQAGSRRIRAFPNSTDITTASSILVDTSFTFAAGAYYSVVHYGYARAGQVPKQGLWIFSDTLTDPASNVGLRVVHVGADLGAVDIYITAASTDPLPATPTFANVQFRTSRAYVTRSPGPIAMRVYATGTTTPALITKVAPAGSTATITGTTNVGGSSMAGSLMTAMIYSSAVAGSAAAVTSGTGTNTTPTVVYWVDRHPPGIAP